MATLHFLFTFSKGQHFGNCASKTKVKELFSSCIMNTFSKQDSECLNSNTTSSCLLKSPDNVLCQSESYSERLDHSLTHNFSARRQVKIYLHISFLHSLLAQSGRGSVGKR